LTPKISFWRLVLGAVTALLIITGGVLAVTRTDRTSTETKPASSTSGDEAAPGSKSGGVEGAPASEAAGGAGSKPESNNANAGAARPFGSPAPGKYRFKLTTSMSGKEPSSREVKAEVMDVSSNPTELRQKVFFTTDEGGGEREEVWQAGGMMVLSESLETRGQKFQCDWEPDILELKLPLKVGQEWNTDSSCTMQGQGVTAQRHRTAKVRVTEIGSSQVAGQTVEVYVINETMTETFGFGTSSSTIETETTTQFASKLGLGVRVSQKGKSTFGTRTFEATSDYELLNLRPE
jgi:hypothetical protein